MKIFKRRILEELTDNFGDVIATEDKIICNVDEKIIKKGHPLVFNVLTEVKKKIIKKNNINQKMWFLIDGINFDKPVYFTGLNDCNIYISNCEFKSSADFDIDGNLYFDNVIMNSCFISSNTLNINNTNIRELDNKNETNIALGGKRSLKIKNSLIGLNKENTNVFVVSTFLCIKNSNINADVLKIHSIDFDIDSDTKVNVNKKLINKEENNTQKLILK